MASLLLCPPFLFSLIILSLCGPYSRIEKRITCTQNALRFGTQISNFGLFPSSSLVTHSILVHTSFTFPTHPFPNSHMTRHPTQTHSQNGVNANILNYHTMNESPSTSVLLTSSSFPASSSFSSTPVELNDKITSSRMAHADWVERMQRDSQSLWYRPELIEFIGKKAVEQLRTRYLQSTARRMKEIWVEQDRWAGAQVESFYSDYVGCFSEIVEAMILKKKQEWIEQATQQYAPYFLSPKNDKHEVYAFTHLLSHIHAQKQGADLVFSLLRQRPDLFSRT